MRNAFPQAAPDFDTLARTAPAWSALRPVRIAILGDFGAGASAGRADTGALLAACKPLNVEFDTLEDAMARLSPAISLPPGPDGRVERMVFRDLDAFHPDTLCGHPQLFAAPASRSEADTLRGVLHRPDFQNLEALWRGVDFLLRRLDTGPALQVHLFDIGVEALAADLSGAGDPADSALYRLLVAQPSEEPDGGYRYIAACYRFDATPAHAELLGSAARIVAHAGARVIAAIAPDAFTDRREPPPAAVQQAFAALRAMPDASALALMAPRFLLRRPYGKKSEPIASFAFEEFTPASGLRGMLWGHPALLAVSVLARPGATLAVGDLPFHYFSDGEGDTIALPCTERLIDADTAVLLRGYGINAVMARKGEPLVRLAGLQAVDGSDLAAEVRRAPGVAVATPPRDGTLVAATGDFPPPIEDPTQDEDTADLDALLASFAEPDSQPGATPDDEDAMDPDLKALLASLI